MRGPGRSPSLPVVDIREIDKADDAAMAQMYAVVVAVRTFQRPFFQPPPLEAVLADLRHDDPGERVTVWGMHDAGELVGAVTLWESLLDNTHSLWAELDVHPDHRRRGHGAAAVAAVERFAREAGRTRIVIDARYPADRADDHPYRRFAERHGYRLGSLGVNRRLALPLPRGRLAELDAAARAAYEPDYRLQSFTRVPEQLAESLCACMNRVEAEAPSGEIDWEPESLTPARLQSYHDLDVASGRQRFTTVAQAVGSVDVVAYTELLVPATMTRAQQSGTYVLPEHRGRRLGMAVKLANLVAVHKARPEVVEIFTGNSSANEWMVAVNEQLGFSPVELIGEFYRRLG